jgi:DNA primase
VFAWLESVFHEHGALGGSALQTEMQGQGFAEDALRWMAQDHLGTAPGNEEAAPPHPQEARQELRRLLNRLLIDRLKQLETEALTQASTGQDPDAQQRWRSLHERRKELMASEASQDS